MTAGQVFSKAMTLLGYRDAAHCDILKSRATVILNAAYVDICRVVGVEYEPIKSLSDRLLPDDETVIDVMVYGVAMFIAQSEGDAAGQAVYCELYNRKRASLATVEKIVDVLPRG